MKANSRLISVLPLIVALFGAAVHAKAQSPTSGEDIHAAKPSPVCANENLNLQVKAALRLVCAQRNSDGPPAAAQGLIVIGFLGGFAKSGDTNHPEVWFGKYLRELY